MRYYLFTATDSGTGKSENFIFNDAIENNTFSKDFIMKVSKTRITEYLNSVGKDSKDFILSVKTVNIKDLNKMPKRPRFINPHDEYGHPHLPDKIRL